MDEKLESGWDLDENYYVALGILLDQRGGSFTYTEAEYDLFRVKYGGNLQIVVSQKGNQKRLELLKERRGNN